MTACLTGTCVYYNFIIPTRSFQFVIHVICQHPRIACFLVITLFTQVHLVHKIPNQWVCQGSICNNSRYSFLIQIICKPLFLTYRWNPNKYYHFQVRLDQGEMVMKGFSTLLQNWNLTTRCSLVSYPGHFFVGEVEVLLPLLMNSKPCLLGEPKHLLINCWKKFKSIYYCFYSHL